MSLSLLVASYLEVLIQATNDWLIYADYLRLAYPEWHSGVCYFKRKKKNTWSWFHVHYVCSKLLKTWVVISSSDFQKEKSWNSNPLSLNNCLIKNTMSWNILYQNITHIISKVVFRADKMFSQYSAACELIMKNLRRFAYYVILCCLIYMWCVARFRIICIIQKTWKTPMEECCF